MWAASEIRLSPTDLNVLKLKYALEDLKGVSGKLLEVGCGAGGMAKAIKFYRPDLEVVGIDISAEAIYEAKKDPQGIRFLKADINNLSQFENESFDAVAMFDVLEHLENPLSALRQIYRILKPKGIVVALVPLDGSLWTVHGLFKVFGFIPKKKYAGHKQQFVRQDVVQLFNRAGFNLKKERYSQHLFHQLVDFIYFTCLYIRGKNVPYSIESYLNQSGQKKGRLALNLAKSLVARISYCESICFQFIPGLGWHVLAIKNA